MITRANNAVNIGPATCFVLFDVMSKLENYIEIVKNLNIYIAINNFYLIIEKIILFNYKVQLLDKPFVGCLYRQQPKPFQTN
jgi:hypothetical protein